MCNAIEEKAGRKWDAKLWMTRGFTAHTEGSGHFIWYVNDGPIFIIYCMNLLYTY